MPSSLSLRKCKRMIQFIVTTDIPDLITTKKVPNLFHFHLIEYHNFASISKKKIPKEILFHTTHQNPDSRADPRQLPPILSNQSPVRVLLVSPEAECATPPRRTAPQASPRFLPQSSSTSSSPCAVNEVSVQVERVRTLATAKKTFLFSNLSFLRTNSEGPAGLPPTFCNIFPSSGFVCLRLAEEIIKIVIDSFNQTSCHSAGIGSEWWVGDKGKVNIQRKDFRHLFRCCWI